MSKKALLFSALALLLAFGFCVEANAQQTKRPINRINRWLGHFVTNGYHVQRKGPDVGYYNPYSPINSQRMSAGSAYSIQYGQPVLTPSMLDSGTINGTVVPQQPGGQAMESGRYQFQRRLQQPRRDDDRPLNPAEPGQERVKDQRK